MTATETDNHSAITPQPVSQAYQVLVARAGGLLVCIELECVERTFSLVALQPVPGGAPAVAGIMNYAGSSLPVIDIAVRLLLPAAPYSLDTPIVVCAHDGRRVGVIVSEIIGIQMLNREDMQLARELGGHGAAFSASLHTQQGLAYLLDSGWLTTFDLYGASGEAQSELRAKVS
ncbi:chemotaxis protein CheW [Sulfuriferula thiophila]|uniref:chemotaxis protein CheW n=1 Tax=Sulfuriferula thiophila TaxID=1781211 RepID=UPI001CB9BEA0|nr:chemotaxis protein CheW [Sulfuriferula thiophila]